MDVAVVHPFLYTRGGAERVVLEVAKEFDAKVFCSRFVPEETFPEFKDVDVEVVKSHASLLLPGFLPVRVRDAVSAGMKFFNKKLDGFDVVNAQGTPAEWIRNRNRPVVWYCHTPNREAFDLYQWRMSRRQLHQKALYWSMIQPYRIIESMIVPKIEHIFANSVNTQKRIKNFLGRDSEVLNPGVDCNSFRCEGFEKFFFYPSRITPEKRFEYAIAAFKEFKKENKGWRLVIAGALVKERHEHVAYYHKIKRMLGSDVDILLDFPNKKLVDLFSRCYSVLYSPVNEDFGIIPLEAMASGKPCIAVNEGGPKEVVLNNKTGFLVDSEADMARKMSLIASNPDKAERMGRAGRRLARSKYIWKAFMKRFRVRLREACKRS